MQQRQPSLWMPSLTAGFIFGFASGIPFAGFLNCLCCSLIMGAGVTCSYLMVKSSTTPLSTGMAVAGGGLSGIFAVPVAGVTWMAFHIVMGGNLAKDWEQALDQMAQNPALSEGAEVLAGVSIYAVMSLYSIVAFFLFTLFGGIGGIIGRALFEKRTPPPASQAGPPSGGPAAGMPPHGGPVPPGDAPPPPMGPPSS